MTQNYFDRYRMRVLEKIRKLGYKKVAEDTGISEKTISNYISGWLDLSYKQAIRIGEILGIE